MKKHLAALIALTLLNVTCNAQAETVIQGVDFGMNNDKAQVMVKVDVLNLLGLFNKGQTYREFDYDSGVSFVQAGEIDPDLVTRILEQYQNTDVWSTRTRSYSY